MGLRSGEYGGRKRSRAPRGLDAAAGLVRLVAAQVSSMKTSRPGSTGDLPQSPPRVADGPLDRARVPVLPVVGMHERQFFLGHGAAFSLFTLRTS